MMAKKIKKIMAMVLALCICFSALPLQALAAEEDTVVETKDGVTTTVNTQTETTKNPATGDTTVTVTIQKDTAGTKESTGETVTGSETKVTTTVTDTDGKKTTTEVADGYERTETEIPDSVENVTVKVPTGTDNPATEENEGQNVATAPTEEPKVSGDEPKGEDDKNYNYTETTEIPGSVTVDTTEVKVEETNIEKVVDENGKVVEGTDLDYVYSEVKPVKGNKEGEVDNDLIIWVFRGHRTELPKEGEKIEGKENYEYQYVGAGNTSQLLPAFLYKSPSPENPDEEPAYIDAEGNKYYTRGRSTSTAFGDIYHDGQKQDAEGGSLTNIFCVPQQFILVDTATGELITTYCADVDTPTEQGFNYNIENLEDADYYDDDQAAMIRTIAENGYWGTSSDEGSLDYMKKVLLESGKFTAEELENLTDGVALTATQMAIWTFSNEMSEMAFLNAHYTKDGNANSEVATNWAGQLLASNSTSNADKKASVDLLMKLYDYLINMDPTPAPDDGENPTTRDTIINADNYIKDMSVTVLEKAKDHENNKDKNKNNDAYVTNLTFALVVEVADGNEDELKVTVVDGNGQPIKDVNGNPIVGRIAGDLQEGEIQLDADDDGNYCFKDIVLTEGENTFKLNLEGIQNLKEGVYLYSSEVEDGVSSQTMVGKAGGKHAVSVSMNLKFELDVKDKVVVKEKYWHNEKVTVKNPPTPRTPPEGPQVPPQEPPQVFNMNRTDGVVEIIDEQVPLAAAPKTGDNSFLFIALALFAAISLCAANFDKKRNYETF